MAKNKKTYLIIINSYTCGMYEEDREVDKIKVDVPEEDFDKEETINMIREKYKPEKFPPGTNWFIRMITYLGDAQAPVITRFCLRSYTEDGSLSKNSGMCNF